jgi:hypothetical protein
MTIRVFAGCAPNHEDVESQSVLEWSIRKHASRPVEIEWMKLSRDPESFWYSDGEGNGWNTSMWATPFSAFRWGIPAFCGFEGRAIYCDSDVVFMADIAELWDQTIRPGKVALAKGGGSWRYCVSLWDCKEAINHLPAIPWLRREAGAHQRMVGYFKERPHLTDSFQGDWNCLDGEGHSDLRDGSLKALHYTDMSTQPQLRHALPRLAAAGKTHWFNGTVKRHPRADVEALFDELLEEAKENGYGPQRYMQDPPFGPIKKQSLQGYKGRPAA